VSFFLSEGTAYCTGRGEVVESISPPLATPPGAFWACALPRALSPLEPMRRIFLCVLAGYAWSVVGETRRRKLGTGGGERPEGGAGGVAERARARGGRF
jgi:hypothetical protein